jgi:hypothetical protein
MYKAGQLEMRVKGSTLIASHGLHGPDVFKVVPEFALFLKYCQNPTVKDYRRWYIGMMREIRYGKVYLNQTQHPEGTFCCVFIRDEKDSKQFFLNPSDLEYGIITHDTIATIVSHGFEYERKRQESLLVNDLRKDRQKEADSLP